MTTSSRDQMAPVPAPGAVVASAAVLPTSTNQIPPPVPPTNGEGKFFCLFKTKNKQQI